MAVVTADFLAGVMTNFRATFQAAFDAANNLAPWRDLAMKVDSNTNTETHAWLGTPPQMVDTTKRDLEMKGLETFNYSLENLTYKAAIEVQRATFEDDKLNLIRPRLEQLGQEAARHPGQLVMQALVTNGLAFDGVAFIADTRTIGISSNIDNNMASGGSGTTLAGFQADLASARALLRSFQDDQGRPMNNVGNVIMVPPGLEQLAYMALNIAFPAASPNVGPAIPATADGVLRANGYSIYVNPYLTDTNDWYLMAVDAANKPFIYQERVAPTLENVLDGTEYAVVRDRYIYSVRARYVVGYGDPRRVVRIVN